MERRKRYLPYEYKFLTISNYFEKILWRIFILAIILLIFFQFLLFFNELRWLIVPLEKIEGSVQSFLVLN